MNESGRLPDAEYYRKRNEERQKFRDSIVISHVGDVAVVEAMLPEILKLQPYGKYTLKDIIATTKYGLPIFVGSKIQINGIVYLVEEQCVDEPVWILSRITNSPSTNPDTWCTCDNKGKCLGCHIERLVREHLGTDGLAYLLAHVKGNKEQL